MTNTTLVEPSHVREALEQCGYGQILRWWGIQADARLEDAAHGLNEFVSLYREEFHDQPDPFGLLSTSPPKAAAFFHPTTLRTSPRIKCAIWRILHGGAVERLRFEYEANRRPTLEFEVVTPYGGHEMYTSDFPDDAKLLRHLGITPSPDGSGMLFDGYYAPATI